MTPPSANPFDSLFFAPTSGGSAASKKEAQTALARVVQRYATTKAYADTGTVVSTTWMKAGRRTSVSHFRTEFVRDKAFRFRQWEESGELLVDIWAAGSNVRTSSAGSVRTGDSLEDELDRVRGVTDLASWIVPTLLFGRELDFPSFLLATIEPIECGKCWVMLTAAGSDKRQWLLSVDGDRDRLRRFRSVSLINTTPESSAQLCAIGARNAGEVEDCKKRAASRGDTYSDELIAYEPTFDDAARALIGRDLNKAPF